MTMRSFVCGNFHLIRTKVEPDKGMGRWVEIIELEVAEEYQTTPPKHITIYGKVAIKALKHACIDALRTPTEREGV